MKNTIKIIKNKTKIQILKKNVMRQDEGIKC